VSGHGIFELDGHQATALRDPELENEDGQMVRSLTPECTEERTKRNEAILDPYVKEVSEGCPNLVLVAIPLCVCGVVQREMVV
jgi:hypothetical protein